MPMPNPIISLAMPVPLRRRFDYLPPEGLTPAQLQALQPGTRVLAPFGHRKLVGIVLQIKTTSDIPARQLRAAERILDDQATLPTTILDLSLWAAQYYQHPVGDAISNALPVLLRKATTPLWAVEKAWRLTTEGKGLPAGAPLKGAARQAQLLAMLQTHGALNREQWQAASISSAVVKALLDKGLIEVFEQTGSNIAEQTGTITSATQTNTTQALQLSTEQQLALNQLRSHSGFSCSLLDGITGSGKTEVYLQLIADHLEQQRQVLILIPEIGLTPQTLQRFAARFNCPISLIHSGLTDRERLQAWRSANRGHSRIVIGTRSAVFTPLPDLGLIIIDEEHDSSYKQQDGFRYSARDLAIKRAADSNCPIVLGSATPSLETLHNAQQGRYQHLFLKQRATGASSPTFELLDICHAPLDEGLSQPLIDGIQQELAAGNQVLVFINRRGFASMLLCHDCGYVAQCLNCDARMTVHAQQRLLRCHHCESSSALPSACPNCNSLSLDFRGQGTQRSEQALKRLFPDNDVIRIDRDTTSKKHAMQQAIDRIHSGEPCILVGTQMLAKGHHFPNITLVAIIDADGGLFSADFRGPEKMGQLLVQVAGRAGRERKAGRVMIQTHQPDHPLITALTQHSYADYAAQLLVERVANGLPPTGHLAILRAEAKQLNIAEDFLQNLRMQLAPQAQVTMLGPLPAPMTKRAGYFRAQLVLQSAHRKYLHQSLQQLADAGEAHQQSAQIRWSIDVDPIDMF